VWLLVLSDQLPIVALVGTYPTNQLIGHRPLLKRSPKQALLSLSRERAYAVLSAISRRYSSLEGRYPCVTHPCATSSVAEATENVRLACVRHAASVYPEPGSNSPSKCIAPHEAFVWALVVECDPGQADMIAHALGCSQMLPRLQPEAERHN
jgi:hypothetical protein